MNRIFKRLFVGSPISSHEELSHRLSKRIALAVFSSDALSSSAYATDEILLVLVAGGALALAFSPPWLWQSWWSLPWWSSPTGKPSRPIRRAAELTACPMRTWGLRPV